MLSAMAADLRRLIFEPAVLFGKRLLAAFKCRGLPVISFILFSTEGELACVSRADGGIVWVTQLKRFKKEKKKKGRIAWAGPILAGGHLILVSSDAEVV